MKIVIASAHPHFPQVTGGAQASAQDMAREMTRRGQDVVMLSALSGTGWTGLRGRILLKLTGRKTVSDRRFGHRSYRGWYPSEGVGEIVARERPDVAIVQSPRPAPIVRGLRDHGVPVVVYVRNVEFDDPGDDLRALAPVPIIANSRFTAARVKAAYGLGATVVNPTFTPESYRVVSARRTVTFVNPHPKKGLDTALMLARRCPDIPFVFVEGWAMTRDERRRLKARLSGCPNVALHPGARDMRDVYADARILLAPSRWEEAFGRVAAEAQFSGIPVLATRCGGLPEAVGPGGLLVDHEASDEAWVAALRRLWDDASFYEALSADAEAHSRRPELDKDRQIAAILRVLGDAAGSGAAPVATAGE